MARGNSFIQNSQSEYIAINHRTETENVLGPLPAGWEKVQYEETDRYFFVHHPTESTTWIDPRTKKIRKANLHDVADLELPYGWEEIYDPAIGIYYADHITKKYFVDGPWEADVLREASKAREALEASKAAAAKLAREQEQEERRKIAEAEAAHAKALKEAAKAEEERLAKERREVAEQARIALAEQEKARQEAEAAAKAEQERQEQERKAVEAAVEAEFAAPEEPIVAKSSKRSIEGKSVEEIEAMKRQLDLETEKRRQIEQQIIAMKEEILRLASSQGVDTSHVIQETEEETIPTVEESENIVDRLKTSKAERKRLEKIGTWIASERDRLRNQESSSEGSEKYSLPSWVANLDRKTIRAKVKKNLPSNPDDMEFVQKIAKFEVYSKESEEKPKAPAGVSSSKNAFVHKPKETVYSEEVEQH